MAFRLTDSTVSGTMARGALRLAWSDCLDATRPPLQAERRFRISDEPSPKRLFDTLDGRIVSVSNQSWQVSVFSVYEDSDCRWIQLGLEEVDGTQEHRLTLCIPADQDVKHAIRILTCWLANPSDTDHIRNVG